MGAITPNGTVALDAEEVGIRSGVPPHPAQRLPTNQRAAEREKRGVDVGPAPNWQQREVVEFRSTSARLDCSGYR